MTIVIYILATIALFCESHGFDDIELLHTDSKRSEDLLHWAITNSDPKKISELADKYKDSGKTIFDELGKDVVDSLFKDEASIMKGYVEELLEIDIKNPKNESDVQQLLLLLQDLVGQVDNGANLHKMGGLEPILDLAMTDTNSITLRESACWVLSSATQNNKDVQDIVMSLGGVKLLISKITTECVDDNEKQKLCARMTAFLSSLLRNNLEGQTEADNLEYFDWLLWTGVTHNFTNMRGKNLGMLSTIALQNSNLSGFKQLHKPINGLCWIDIIGQELDWVDDKTLSNMEDYWLLFSAIHNANPKIVDCHSTVTASHRWFNFTNQIESAITKCKDMDNYEETSLCETLQTVNKWINEIKGTVHEEL
eukprot:GHVL01033771.1.p1 GENE.GHVL01033771.1~~GHVL01033771.1.p1  ORF type:complete len:367 (+),score=70.81 GHVL01033771.1:68-1168(+)